jgi:hypothetical protein
LLDDDDDDWSALTFGGCRWELASSRGGWFRMPAFVLLDGEEDGAIVDDGFLRLFMMGVRFVFL